MPRASTRFAARCPNCRTRGGSGSCGSFQAAINTARNNGSVVVVAAGNSNANVSGFSPANCSGIISVAATDRQGNRASYSNYGTGITVSAPGGETATTTNGVTPGTEQDLVTNVGDRVFFAFDQYDLTSEARATVEKQAQWLKTYPSVNIMVEGHCDERGTREYNLALGEKRAMAVRNYLIALGVDAGRIQTISYGKERPAVTGSDEAAWAQNRRGVLVVQ